MVLMARLRSGPLLFFLLALVSFVSADYYIDDTNTTLTYSSGPKAAWAPYAIGGETLELLLPNGTYQVIDAFVCYNHTYRYAACFDTDTCLLTVPFTGSGITVYAYQAGPVGINASITIDGAYAQTNVLSAPPAPAYEIANVSMFNVQQLPSGPHTLNLLINDLSGSYSGMMFDYAYVNESLVANSTTTALTTATSTAASASAAVSSSSGSQYADHSSITGELVLTMTVFSADIGAIVGGVIAMVAVIVIGIFACIWLRRRRRHTPEMIDLHSGSPSPPFYPNTAYDPPFTNSAGRYNPDARYNPLASTAVRSDLTPLRTTEFSSFLPLVPNRLGSSEVRRTLSSSNNGQEILTPFTATPSASNSSGTRDSKTRLALSNDTANAPSSWSQTGQAPPSGSRRDASPSLTDEQADFINSLHHNNVHAAAIARVMERMLADRHAGIREWERETRLARTYTISTAPPSYDFVAEGR
ncbi:hypothetical protein J3R82DRAFT_5372 [Butyriboletus roseoflavus]|nr:hypothetical protein J3R82DRAFT_5372 [Butyriboletus roseoflavus]